MLAQAGSLEPLELVEGPLELAQQVRFIALYLLQNRIIQHARRDALPPANLFASLKPAPLFSMLLSELFFDRSPKLGLGAVRVLTRGRYDLLDVGRIQAYP